MGIFTLTQCSTARRTPDCSVQQVLWFHHFAHHSLFEKAQASRFPLVASQLRARQSSVPGW